MLPEGNRVQASFAGFWQNAAEENIATAMNSVLSREDLRECLGFTTEKVIKLMQSKC
jgi:hypothetical protein